MTSKTYLVSAGDSFIEVQATSCEDARNTLTSNLQKAGVRGIPTGRLVIESPTPAMYEVAGLKPKS